MPSAASAASSSGTGPASRVRSLARLVAGPELVPERLDDVVRRDADVLRSAVDHAEHDDTTRGRPATSRPFASRADGIA